MKIKKVLFRSFSSTINSFYIALIALFTTIGGSGLYFAATTQLSENTSATMDSVLSQKTEYLSYIYQDIFEQFYVLTQNNAVEDLAADSPNVLTDYVELSDEVDYLFNYNTYLIDSIYITINGIEIAHSDQQVFTGADSLDNEEFIDYANNEGFFWLNNRKNTLFSGEQSVQTIGYVVENNVGETKDFILMNLNLSFINSILQDLSLEGSYMMIMSEESYYVPDEKEDDQRVNEVIFNQYLSQELTGGLNEIAVEGSDDYYVRYDTIGSSQWDIALVTPAPDLFGSQLSVFVLLFLLVLVLFILAAVFLRMVRRYISNPILKLADSMMITETYNEKIKQPDIVPDELRVLYKTYNNLIDRNVRLIDQITAEQKEKMDLEVALLQAQISPHFLYNTLYSIKGLCDMGMSDEASQMTSELSDFFRTSLSRGREVITIEEELKNAKSYLYIMETRYGDFFDYDITIPERLYHYMIVKLSLQPIIENAIYHGVMNDRKDGRIIISGYETSEDIELVVWDNGKGIEPGKLKRIEAEIKAPYITSDRKETGVGLRSVDIRIRNRYGNKYGLKLESEPGSYTKVSIRIPKIEGEIHV